MHVLFLWIAPCRRRNWSQSKLLQENEEFKIYSDTGSRTPICFQQRYSSHRWKRCSLHDVLSLVSLRSELESQLSAAQTDIDSAQHAPEMPTRIQLGQTHWYAIIIMEHPFVGLTRWGFLQAGHDNLKKSVADHSESGHGESNPGLPPIWKLLHKTRGGIPYAMSDSWYSTVTNLTRLYCSSVQHSSWNVQWTQLHDTPKIFSLTTQLNLLSVFTSFPK
jgi:hypothetical protein